MAAAKESEREGKQGERKQRTPEEAEKVLVNRGVPACGVTVPRDSRLCARVILPKLFGIRVQADVPSLYIRWTLLKVMKPFSVHTS